MKTIIQVGMVALLVGGLSAGASFYHHQQLAKVMAAAQKASATAENAAGQDQSATDTGDDKTAEDSEVAASSEDAPGETLAQLEQSFQAQFTPPQNNDLPGIEPPAAVRPPFDPNGDEAGDLINKMRLRASATSQQERKLKDREDVMNLIIADLRMEQANSARLRKRYLGETKMAVKSADNQRRSANSERDAMKTATEAERVKMIEEKRETERFAEERIDAIRREKDEALLATEDAMKQIREDQVDLRKQLDAILHPPQEIDRSGSPAETANIKNLASVMDSMPAEDVARIAEEMMKKGRFGAVVVMLNAMKPRQSAKVISTITEKKPELAAVLIDQLKRLKPEEEATEEPEK